MSAISADNISKLRYWSGSSHKGCWPKFWVAGSLTNRRKSKRSHLALHWNHFLLHLHHQMDEFLSKQKFHTRQSKVSSVLPCLFSLVTSFMSGSNHPKFSAIGGLLYLPGCRCSILEHVSMMPEVHFLYPEAGKAEEQWEQRCFSSEGQPSFFLDKSNCFCYSFTSFLGKVIKEDSVLGGLRLSHGVM